MGRVILNRIAGAIPVVLLVTLITFGLMRLVPGDPTAALTGLSGTPQEREQLRKDLGRSILLGQSVTKATFERLPISLALSAYALVLTLLLGLASGILAALRQ